MPEAAARGIFCNRTMNLRSIKAIGYDMDYTLLHYQVEEWEREAFRCARDVLASWGWPVEQLAFDPSVTIRGLVFDLELGNLLKATRFGYVIQAFHGTRRFDFNEVRSSYGATVVDLGEERFEFTNTLFSLSEESLYMQLVDLFDQGKLPKVRGYAELYRAVAKALGISHQQGSIKERILADPDRFVVPDPELIPTLNDQRLAGKRLILITNSDWAYTQAIMSHVVNPQMPDGGSWRDLFDIIIVSANKPGFFADRADAFEVVDEEHALLSPLHGPLQPGSVYFGGHAEMVERSLGLRGGDILYVGDHLFGDVHVLKSVLGWRTALIVRELEDEVGDAAEFSAGQDQLTELMAAKVKIERRLAHLRMAQTRVKAGLNSGLDEIVPAGNDVGEEMRAIEDLIDATMVELSALDDQVSALAEQAGMLGNEVWGPLMRAGSDKSLFARQVEKHADIYTSRVSNLGLETPYAYLRAARGSLPHDASILNDDPDEG